MATIEKINKFIKSLGEFRWRAAASGIECEDGSHKLVFRVSGTTKAKFQEDLTRWLADHNLESIPEDAMDIEVIDGFVALQGTTATSQAAHLVAPGVQIGFQLTAPFPPTAAGTLGCFVRKKGSRKCFLLSANHVLAMNGWARNNPLELWSKDPTEIFASPLSFCYPSKSIASLHSVDYLRGIRYPHPNEHECALAELRNLPTDTNFPFPVLPRPRLPQCGDRVKIYTNRYPHAARYGDVKTILCNREMRFEFGRFRFHRQFLVQGGKGVSPPFAEKGDSGSLIFLHNPGKPDDGTPLGMLYGASAPDDLFLACPLVQFFQDHKLTIFTHKRPK
jgi:hypothetical protein